MTSLLPSIQNSREALLEGGVGGWLLVTQVKVKIAPINKLIVESMAFVLDFYLSVRPRTKEGSCKTQTLKQRTGSLLGPPQFQEDLKVQAKLLQTVSGAH